MRAFASAVHVLREYPPKNECIRGTVRQRERTQQTRSGPRTTGIGPLRITGQQISKTTLLAIRMTDESSRPVEDDPGDWSPSDDGNVDREQLLERLNSCIVPLGATTPTADQTTLQPLQDRFDAARVIGLGEATHGTREFFECKHRLLRYLITELDLRRIGFETTYAETIPMDDYVRRGTGDATAALETLSVWPWKTDSVRDLLEWIRRFNDERPDHDRVRIHGLDVQHAAPPADRLVDAIDEIAPAYPDSHREVLSELAADGLVRGSDVPSAERIEPATQAVEALQDRTTESGLQEQHWWCLRTLRQAVDVARKRTTDGIEAFSVARDRAMAENALRVVDRSDVDRLAIWAHNAHIQRTPSEYEWGTTMPMGRVLADRCDGRYLPVGFDFGAGVYRAVDGRGDGYGDRGEWSVDPLSEQSLTALLEAVDAEVFYVDVADVVDDPVVGPWITTERPRRWSGAVYYGEQRDHIAVDALPEAFDGLVFVQESTPTTLIE